MPCLADGRVHARIDYAARASSEWSGAEAQATPGQASIDSLNIFVGNPAIVFAVSWNIRVQQVEGNTPNLRPPRAGMNHPIG
jgi:hypothetical protein